MEHRSISINPDIYDVLLLTRAARVTIVLKSHNKVNIKDLKGRSSRKATLESDSLRSSVLQFCCNSSLQVSFDSSFLKLMVIGYLLASSLFSCPGHPRTWQGKKVTSLRPISLPSRHNAYLLFAQKASIVQRFYSPIALQRVRSLQVEESLTPIGQRLISWSLNAQKSNAHHKSDPCLHQRIPQNPDKRSLDFFFARDTPRRRMTQMEGDSLSASLFRKRKEGRNQRSSGQSRAPYIAHKSKLASKVQVEGKHEIDVGAAIQYKYKQRGFSNLGSDLRFATVAGGEFSFRKQRTVYLQQSKMASEGRKVGVKDTQEGDPTV
uniref:Pentatricopeptide repeat-containing protein n=1 Tax=Steinernema glaseri TaxID=37863 RepID=A0A1I8AIQ8_9BILA